MANKTQHTPNDQRGIVKNPNNEPYRKDLLNRQTQQQPTAGGKKYQ